MGRQKRFYKYMALFFICFFGLIVIAAVSAYHMTGLVEYNLITGLNETTKQSAIAVKQTIEKDVENLDITANAISAVGGPESDSAKTFVLEQDWLEEGMRIVVSSLDGKSYSSDGFFGDVAVEEIFRKAIGGETIISDARKSIIQPDGDDVIVIMTPIYDENIIIGTVTLECDVEHYKKIIQTPVLGGEGNIYIIKSSGELLFWDREEGRELGVNMEKDFTAGDFKENQPEFSRMESDINSGMGGSIYYRAGNDKSYYVSYLPLEVNDWFIVNQIDSNILDGRKAELVTEIILVAIISVMVTSILIIALLKSRESKNKIMENIALYDRLTGLANFEYISRRYKQIIDKSGWSYLLFRIPDFDKAHSIFGNDVSVRILRDVADILKNYVSGKEIAARISEDCFAVLFKGSKDMVSGRIDGLFERLYSISANDGNIVYNYHCSYVGVAFCLEENSDFAKINYKANMVIEKQPDSVGIKWHWFDENERISIDLNTSLLPELSRAIQYKEFIPYFQPQYDANTKEVIGAEVLARWKHPEYGILMPGSFVHLMEAGGCVLELDLLMLEQACIRINKWLSEGIMPVRLSVNISRLNLHRRDLIDRILNIVRKYNVPPKLIVLELTETSVYDNSEKVINIITRLKNEGFLISIDDFGTGYSSLDMLREIPADEIKFDRKFLINFEDGARGKTIFRHIINMAKELNLEIICEGVETQKQYENIKDIGCDSIQGFYFSEPLEDSEFEKIMLPH